MNSYIVRHAKITDVELINRIAYKSWWTTYASFLSEEQISFMLTEMYNLPLLSKSIANGIGFLLVEHNSQALGFVSFTPKANSREIYRIEKLYILKEAHGYGLGKALINEVESLAKKQGFTQLELNVNRNNPSVEFYTKQGFNIAGEVDIPYYQFVLNDYVMRKEI